MMHCLPLPVRDFNGRTVATLPPEIDLANSGAVCYTLLALLTREPSGVIADMSGTSFCDVSGIRAVMRAHRRAQALGSELRVVITHEAVQKVFRLTGADTKLRIYTTLGQALSGHGTSVDGSGADADRPPVRPPADDAPRPPRPRASRTVMHPAPETPAGYRPGGPAQRPSATAAGDGKPGTRSLAGYADQDASRTDRPGSPGQADPEHRTHELVMRVHEALCRSSATRSQTVSAFARLAATYADLADLAEQRALRNTRDAERMKTVSVTARGRAIDCRQLAMQKPSPSGL